MVCYCDLPVTNPVMIFLQIMFAIKLLVMGLVWQFLFFPEITMCAFIVIGSSTKFCRGSTIVLLSANPTLYQIYHHLRITLNFFLYLINLVLMYTFKSTCIFHVYNWQGGLFPPHGSHLPTSVISGKAALTKCKFKFLLFLKPIIGTSGNTFLWSSSQARIQLRFQVSKHWVMRNIKC